MNSFPVNSGSVSPSEDLRFMLYVKLLKLYIIFAVIYYKLFVKALEIERVFPKRKIQSSGGVSRGNKLSD